MKKPVSQTDRLPLLVGWFFAAFLISPTWGADPKFSVPKTRCLVALTEFASSLYRISEEMVGPQDFSRFHPIVRPKKPKGIDLRNIAPAGNRVVLGIENRNHAFLVAGGVRFDGRIFYDPTVNVYDAQIPAGEGFFAVMEGVPSSTVEILKRALLAPPDEAYFGCVHAIYSKLAQAGIRLEAPGMIIKTSVFFDLMVNGGFVFPNGQRIRTTLYATPEVDFATRRQELARFDDEILSSVATRYEGLSPDEVLHARTGQVRPMSSELRVYLSELTSGKPSGRILKETGSGGP